MSFMRPRTLFIATGVAAWLGGLATAFAVSSCDYDTCAMNPEDPLCRPEYLTAEGEADERLVTPPADPPVCDYAAHPSVHVVPVRRFDDYNQVVDVDSVWFEHEGQTYEARCLDSEGTCSGTWIAGYELEGRIEVSTEYCDKVVSKSVEVGRTEDGCHVETEFMLLEVDTTGCLTGQTPPAPPPVGPWSLVNRLANG